MSPTKFNNTNFVTIDSQHLVEEETIPDYVAEEYYPVVIGQVFKNRYQIVGKLGYGSTSTVWLARDLEFVERTAKNVMNMTPSSDVSDL